MGGEYHTQMRYQTLEEYRALQIKLNALYARADGRTAEGKKVKRRIIEETMKSVKEWKQLLGTKSS